MFSNTAQAHQLDQTRDWVVIFQSDPGNRAQWTIVTSRQGPTKGLRVIRGREAECEAHDARLQEERLIQRSLPMT
jgi:hypothetical protein